MPAPGMRCIRPSTRMRWQPPSRPSPPGGPSRRGSGRLPPVLRVGLTGGIGAGKSTVAATFAELGAVVVDPAGVGLAGEVAVLDHAGEVDHPLELQLPPPPAHVRGA